jgi:hypothetical protein
MAIINLVINPTAYRQVKHIKRGISQFGQIKNKIKRERVLLFELSNCYTAEL